MGVVLVHKPRPAAVQPGHGIHGPLVGLPDVLIADHQLDAVPALSCIQPLVGVHSHLSSQWLGQHEDVTNDGGIGTAKKSGKLGYNKTGIGKQTILLT